MLPNFCRADRSDGRIRFQKLFDFFGFDCLAPFDIDGNELNSVGLADFSPPFAKLSSTNNDGFIPFRKEVGNRPFHCTGPGGGENQHLVFRLEEILHPFSDFSIDFLKLRLPVVHDGLRHLEEHLRRKHGRSRGEQIFLFHSRFLSKEKNQIILFDIHPHVNTLSFLGRQRTEGRDGTPWLRLPRPGGTGICSGPGQERNGKGQRDEGVDFWRIIL